MTEEILLTRLTELGLSAVSDHGRVTLTNAQGVSCVYSARIFVPVVFPGLTEKLAVKITRDGTAEIRINDTVYPMAGNVGQSIDECCDVP